MTDINGMHLKIGDTVIFTNGGQSETGIYFGEIYGFSTDGEQCKILKYPKMTKQAKGRYSDEVSLCLYTNEELREKYPERFL